MRDYNAECKIARRMLIYNFLVGGVGWPKKLYINILGAEGIDYGNKASRSRKN